ncbi:MAG TPA: hypothetical protein VFZ58_01820 [Candidatus Saccharimonadales bacterium]
MHAESEPRQSEIKEEQTPHSNKETFARLVHKGDTDEDDLYDDFDETETDTYTENPSLEELSPKDLYPGVEFDKDEQVVQDTLHYQPFEPEKALKNIRNLTEGELALSPAEQHEIKLAKLGNFKHQLEAQQRGMAAIIQSLFDKVQGSGDTSAAELWQLVADTAEQYKLNYTQLLAFKRAIEAYEDKHRAVEKYRARYPDDTELFQACFGFPPQGNLEVVTGPMTIMFRCWNPDDYSRIHNGNQELDEEARIAAGQTSGFALQDCNIDELAGTITAENGSYLPRKRELVEEVTIGQSVIFPRLPESLRIKGADNREYELTKTALSGSDEHLQLALSDTQDPSRVIANLNWTPYGVTPIGLESAGPSSIYNLQINEQIGFGLQIYGTVFEVQVQKGQDVEVRSTTLQYVDKFDDSRADLTRVHEDQHQFNALFEPLDWQTGQYELIRRVISRELPASEALQELLEGTVRLHRASMGVDRRARDEIIAFYTAGKAPGAIYLILRDVPSYDYKAQYASRLIELPELIQKELQEEIEVLTAKGSYEDLVIDPLKVREIIDQVFGEDYTKDLKKWTEALALLEQKGYSREEIISMVYQEPAFRWTALARRASTKVTSA